MAELTCDDCSTVARTGDAVCRVCGSPLRAVSPASGANEPASPPVASAPDETRCEACGNTLRPDEDPCSWCGTPGLLTSPPPDPPPPPSPPPPLDDGSDPWAVDPIAVRLAASSPLGEDREVTIYSGDAIQIGRSVGPFMALAGDNISGEHALISVGESCVHVTDLGTDRRGSTNGTFVDGRRIPPNDPVPVENGSTITCAQDPPLTIQVVIER